MVMQRYQSSGDAKAQQRLSQPLTFHFSKKTMNTRLFKASMGEALATWDFQNVNASGIPTQEVKELYRRQVLSYLFCLRPNARFTTTPK